MRKFRLAAMALLVILPLVYFLGPSRDIDESVALPTIPADVQAYIASVEASYGNVLPDTERKIIWANEDRQKTKYSIVYLPGFSATRKETEPFADEVAKTFGANLYYARLRGHGQPPQFLGKAKVEEWFADTAEALAIGEAIGENVIVMACSTGATLAIHLTQQLPAHAPKAFVFISPNFGAVQAGSELAAGPWGIQLVHLLVGDEYEWKSMSRELEQYWTNHFPSDVLVEVASLVRLVRKSDLSKIKTPTLFFYSERDQVTSPKKIKSAFESLGSPQKEIDEITNSNNPSHHVLAGYLLSKDSHNAVRDKTIAFLRSVFSEKAKDEKATKDVQQ